jgi:hypothetical protein
VQTRLDEWRRVIAVNLDGVFLGVKHAISAMTGRGGAIVNVSSTAGLVGMPLNGAYGAAKAGVLMLTKCAALECARLDPPRIESRHRWWLDCAVKKNSSYPTGRFDSGPRETGPHS